MFCINCGKKLSAAAKFCYFCGTNVIREADRAIETEEIKIQEKQIQKTEIEVQNQEIQKKKVQKTETDLQLEKWMQDSAEGRQTNTNKKGTSSILKRL